ncbi:MAG: asparagine synthase [Blastocatellia bacterium AA13]|nr:MAG: asparagine synthase [Blastocatellia bacterium AA13]
MGFNPLSYSATDHTRSSWWLVYGETSSVPRAAWQEGPVAAGIAKPEINSGHRFLVIGDVWLSNRSELMKKFADARHELSDCALIAHIWEELESATPGLLEGMFAFAVWDRERRVLSLVRDPVGARTLYYTVGGPIRWIAPSLATLIPKVSAELDLIALRDYLSCAFVPGDRTMLRNVRELRPAAILELPEERVHTYWNIEERITEADQPLEAYAGRLRSLLEEVLSEYLPANEPVGAYLSGGLDSSLVVALAARLHSKPIHTYSIHFGADCPNELEFSDLVASHCGANHRIIEITPNAMWDQLPETMSLLDDPIGDPLTVPNLILGRTAKESVNVILNGEGGDPCFGGPKNQPMLLTNLYQSAISYENPQEDPSDSVSMYLASFQKCSQDLRRLLLPDVFARTAAEPSIFESDLNSEASYVNRLMFINTRFKGADHILTKVNNLTSALGLEGRSPLFDRRIVDLSLTVPPQYKLSGAEEKAVLKAAVRDLLPEAILKRPKSGMMVPVQLWFRRQWRRRARALLLSRRACIRDYLNREVIREWLDYRGDTWSRYGVKLWLLVSLELWLRSHQPKLS